MNEAPATTEVMTSALGSLDSIPDIKFSPRQLRAIEGLAHGPKMREELDRWCGCSNGPELVRKLRIKGISIDCEEVRRIDRDGRPCYPGKYSLSADGHEAAQRMGLI